MLIGLVAAGSAWTVAAVVAGIGARRPGPVLDRQAARSAWQEIHGLEAPLQATSRLVGAYVTLTQALARPLSRAGVAPNAVTASAVGLALVAAGLIGGHGAWEVAGGLLVLGTGLLDGLDGAVAVLSGRATDLGFVLDSVVDRVVDLILLVGPYLASRTGATLRATVAAGAALMLMEYVRARSQIRRPAVERITPGERPTRIVVIGMGAVGAGTVGTPRWWWPAGLGALAAVCMVSAAVLLFGARDGSPG